MSETAILIAFAVVIGLGMLIWVLYLAATLVLLFTAFVIQLPIIFSILMFILFPPTFIVFLAGLAFIQLGVGETPVSSDSEPSGSGPQDIAASTDNRYPGSTNVKSDKDTRPLKPSPLTKMPDGLAGLDWLAKYTGNEEPAEVISKGPRVVVTSFDKFNKGDIVDLKGVGRVRCYLNGIAVEKSTVAKNTRAVDKSGIEAYFGS